MQIPVLKAENLVVKQGDQLTLNNVSFTVKAGEQWLVTGASGSGKTTLLKVIAGRQHFAGHITFHDDNHGLNRKVILVDQQHYFKTLSNTTAFYYQQRYNSSGSGDTITVKEDLGKAKQKDSRSVALGEEMARLFGIEKLYDEPLIQLSNGENKRLQIVKALLQQPAFLLLDSPFTGLDVQSRQTLESVLETIAARGVHLILTGPLTYVPRFITNVLSLSSGGSATATTRSSMGELASPSTHPAPAKPGVNLVESLLKRGEPAQFEFAIRMQNVNIVYEHPILQNISWEVRNGERWALQGPNGSGKSTLLSLVNADNPQAYANEIYLFDKRRGTGETIWEIKKKTGYVSPELHLYFDKGTTCFNVVASGLFDTIGLFRRISEQQAALVKDWMRLLNIEKLAARYLSQCSNSQQRMVLLARALIKNPPLLILDEPCQGLDDEQVEFFKALVNDICIAGNKTLIYVSHYPAELPACITRFIRLENGRRVE